MSQIAKWFLVCMFALGALLTIASVGKPRKTLTGGMAAAIAAMSTLYIVLILAYWSAS